MVLNITMRIPSNFFLLYSKKWLQPIKFCPYYVFLSKKFKGNLEQISNPHQSDEFEASMGRV